jgi:hypothetical protein
LAALKISSDFCTVYAFSPLSTEIAARTTDRERRALIGAAGRAEIPDTTAAAAAAAAAPAIFTGLSPLASKGGGGEVEQIRRDKKFQRGLVRLGLSLYYFPSLLLFLFYLSLAGPKLFLLHLRGLKRAPRKVASPQHWRCRPKAPPHLGPN